MVACTPAFVPQTMWSGLSLVRSGASHRLQEGGALPWGDTPGIMTVVEMGCAQDFPIPLAVRHQVNKYSLSATQWWLSRYLLVMVLSQACCGLTVQSQNHPRPQLPQLHVAHEFSACPDRQVLVALVTWNPGSPPSGHSGRPSLHPCSCTACVSPCQVCLHHALGCSQAIHWLAGWLAGWEQQAK